MKYFIGIVFLMMAVGCTSDDDTPVTDDNVSINGTWRPYKYEFRGKNIMLNDCEDKGVLSINTDFSGFYDRYEKSETTGECIATDSYAGKWNYDKLYSNLTLTYNESGENKIIKKQIQGFSDAELRIQDNSKNLDNVPGNDEAVLVFKREL